MSFTIFFELLRLPAHMLREVRTVHRVTVSELPRRIRLLDLAVINAAILVVDARELIAWLRYAAVAMRSSRVHR